MVVTARLTICVEHDLLDEIKVAFAHDELLEIIDWTRKETTQTERTETNNDKTQ